ncbi:MAG: hypothetical protein ACYTKD_21870 [Planctomycetota bacterium]|jgi:hypothetical protein
MVVVLPTPVGPMRATRDVFGGAIRTGPDVAMSRSMSERSERRALAASPEAPATYSTRPRSPVTSSSGRPCPARASRRGATVGGSTLSSAVRRLRISSTIPRSSATSIASGSGAVARAGVWAGRGGSASAISTGKPAVTSTAHSRPPHHFCPFTLWARSMTASGPSSARTRARASAIVEPLKVRT